MLSDELILTQCWSYDCTAARPQVEPSLKAANQEGRHRVRGLVQTPRVVHARMAEDHWGRTTPMEVHSPEDHAKTNVTTVRKSKDRQVDTAAMATDGWDCTTLRMMQLEDHNTGPLLWEVEARQHLEQKDITGCSCAYKHCWAQWKSLTVRDDVLQCCWQ
jgi:hypothetical protein